MESSVNRRKKDYAQKISNVANEFLDFVSREFPYECSYFEEKIRENVDALLDIEKPRVMVYGIYNSGKSTLINALCKEDVAEMADRPMTDTISEYDRGDYYLIDSPGVDAPIEHERVTEDYLNKCHVILFVISTKGMFEDRDNYVRLAKLIEKDIPFIIVLNDRGVAIGKDMTAEEKNRVKAEHQQEIKMIQYKVIQNLIHESNNKKIVDKYEVVVLNAKKALLGILRDKPTLYEASNIEFLDKRITQLLQNDETIKAVFVQPIGNLKECINEIEKTITQEMSGNSDDDFSMRLHVMASKKENIMQDLRVLTKQAVYSYMEDVTNAYINGEVGVDDTVVNMIFSTVEGSYSAKLNELDVYLHQNFSSLDLYEDTESGLNFDGIACSNRTLALDFDEYSNYAETEYALQGEVKKSFFDNLKSKKKKEKERYERLTREAEYRNQQAQYRVQEQMRKKQEARQLASSSLDELLRDINNIVMQGINDKYNSILSQIQEADDRNKERSEYGRRQMAELNSMKDKVLRIENELA